MNHDYAMALLSWVVVEPINGHTDSYVVAAFGSRHEAESYATHLNDMDPDRDYDFEAEQVGTRSGRFNQ